MHPSKVSDCEWRWQLEMNEHSDIRMWLSKMEWRVHRDKGSLGHGFFWTVQVLPGDAGHSPRMSPWNWQAHALVRLAIWRSVCRGDYWRTVKTLERCWEGLGSPERVSEGTPRDLWEDLLYWRISHRMHLSEVSQFVRETGAIYQIGVLTRERCTFGGSWKGRFKYLALRK